MGNISSGDALWPVRHGHRGVYPCDRDLAASVATEGVARDVLGSAHVAGLGSGSPDGTLGVIAFIVGMFRL